MSYHNQRNQQHGKEKEAPRQVLSEPQSPTEHINCTRDPEVGDFYNLRIELKRGEALWRLRENVLTSRGPEERVCEWLPFEHFSPHLLTARGAFQGFVFDRLGWQPMERKP